MFLMDRQKTWRDPRLRNTDLSNKCFCFPFSSLVLAHLSFDISSLASVYKNYNTYYNGVTSLLCVFLGRVSCVDNFFRSLCWLIMLRSWKIVFCLNLKRLYHLDIFYWISVALILVNSAQLRDFIEIELFFSYISSGEQKRKKITLLFTS